MRKLILLTLLTAGCTDAGQTQIEVPFALFASDELSTSVTGLCGFTPQLQMAIIKESGFLEVDPAINPAAEYTLGVQVENYLDTTQLVDSNGTTLVGQNRNDFHVERVVINYLDIGHGLGISGAGGGPVAQATVLESGTVRPGGTQNAAAIAFTAVPNNVVQSWLPAFQGGLNSDTVVLAVQIFGSLGSGEQASSGIFHFPLTVCFDCGGISPTAKAGQSGGCPAQTAPVALGHGPCCAAQDFTDVCLPCGQAGQPCCSGGTCNANGGTVLTCSGSSTTSEHCGYPNDGAVVCAKPTM